MLLTMHLPRIRGSKDGLARITRETYLEILWFRILLEWGSKSRCNNTEMLKMRFKTWVRSKMSPTSCVHTVWTWLINSVCLHIHLYLISFDKVCIPVDLTLLFAIHLFLSPLPSSSNLRNRLESRTAPLIPTPPCLHELWISSVLPQASILNG